MRKLLIATTALAVVGGGAIAEMSITVGGSAEFGMDYDSDPQTATGAATTTVSKHSFVHDFGITFTGSGTSDGGLSFGATAGFDNKSGGGAFDTGKVHVSGSFGTITVGDNDSADLVAGGINDVGMNGVGVDDVAESVRGQTASQFRYDNSFGQIALAITAGTTSGTAAVKSVAGLYRGTGEASDTVSTAEPHPDHAAESDTGSFGDYAASAILRAPVSGSAAVAADTEYAFGMKFNANGMSIGVGYDSKKVLSAGLGYTSGQISGNVFYSSGKANKTHTHGGLLGWGAIAPDDNAQVLETQGPDGNAGDPATNPAVGNLAYYDVPAGDLNYEEKRTGIGADLSYTIGASKLILSYARLSISNGLPYAVPAMDGDRASVRMVDGEPTNQLVAVANTVDGAVAGFDDDEDSRAHFAMRSGSLDAFGIGVSHDLGGGASLVAGFGQVPMHPKGAGVAGSSALNTADKNKASVGLTFAF